MPRILKRDDVIQELLDHLYDLASADDHFLYSIIQEGFKGLDNYTNAELAEEYNQAFVLSELEIGKGTEDDLVIVED